MIHTASHFDREKRVVWISISMHACDPVPIVTELRLAALRAAGAPLKLARIVLLPTKQGNRFARLLFTLYSRL